MADSTYSARSPPSDCILNDGTCCASASTRFGTPVCDKASAGRTTMGAALSAAVMPVVRVPVTMMVSVPSDAASTAKTGAPAAAMVASAVPSSRPGPDAWWMRKT